VLYNCILVFFGLNTLRTFCFRIKLEEYIIHYLNWMINPFTCIYSGGGAQNSWEI
jgi:hypothetical protein